MLSDPTFNTCASLVTGGHLPRVWSLLVTVFGDMAQDPGTRIAGTTLQDLMGLIGIKPEATRVALHRLRKDGWIDSTRRGRTSQYGLTPQGHAESAKASPRIYGPALAPGKVWLLLANPGTSVVAQENWLRLGGQCYIAPDCPGGTDLLCVPLDKDAPLPGWVRAALIPDWLRDQSAELFRRLCAVQTALGDRPALTSLEIAALRVLIVHEWRRIALKTPPLPETFFPAGWEGPRCRAAVTDLLKRLPAQIIALPAEADTA